MAGLPIAFEMQWEEGQKKVAGVLDKEVKVARKGEVIVGAEKLMKGKKAARELIVFLME